jgi:enamine deaminase RidA (YjgF/YER057c/UK114 family)
MAQAPSVVRSGNFVFISGIIATDAAGRIAASDVKAQTRIIFDKLKVTLASVGAGLEHVVKTSIYFNCPAEQPAIDAFLADVDAVRTGYFSAPGPTTTEVRCGLDTEGALLMLDAWVVIGGRREVIAPPGHWSWGRTTPFVHGWKVDDMLFIGGQRSLDSNGKVLGVGDIEIQTDESFRNLDTMLRAGGGDRNDLMRQNTYFRFFGEGREVTQYWEKMTNVRRRYMSVPSAAGAGLRIEGMPKLDELIQVEGIGVLGKERQRLQPANHWDWSIPNTQFTQGWAKGPLIFIGGQISADNKARAVGRDMETQARNVFQFIRNTLAEGNFTEADVQKLYIYFYAEGDWADIARTRADVARVQAEFYPGDGPAVTAIRVAGFAFENLLIEIEAFGVRGSDVQA